MKCAAADFWSGCPIMDYVDFGRQRFESMVLIFRTFSSMGIRGLAAFSNKFLFANSAGLMYVNYAADQ